MEESGGKWRFWIFFQILTKTTQNGKIIQHPTIFEKEPKEVILEGNELYEEEVLQEEAAYFVKDMGGEWKETPALTIKGESNLTPKQEQQLDKFINEFGLLDFWTFGERPVQIPWQSNAQAVSV